MSLKEHLRLLTFVGLVAVLASATACEEPKRADPRDAVLADFAKRVDAYAALRNRLADSVGELDPTGSQAEIATRATSLAQAITAERNAAKPGDIFTPEVATILALLIKEEYSRRSDPVQETREDQQEELPDFVPRVNQIYPTTYPLATFPPALLPLLPSLPENVEYRIAQNYLILRDIEANLIVDFMPNAVPSGA
ncbi:MAG: hypothetical protein H0T48_02495 [Gemmatimonadaceae bacterium]|nr:hypothetical protein [Gemmatimonadaceae bacterium]